MGDSSVFALVVRMLVSLGTVLAIVGVAFLVARRRVNSMGASRRSKSARASRSARRSTPPAIEVVGRAGLSKGSMAVALRFGDSVVLVGVSEQAPTTVIAEMETARWHELQSEQEYRVPATGTDVPSGLVGSPESIIGARPRFVEALREATTRRG